MKVVWVHQFKNGAVVCISYMEYGTNILFNIPLLDLVSYHIRKSL